MICTSLCIFFWGDRALWIHDNLFIRHSRSPRRMHLLPEYMFLAGLGNTFCNSQVQRPPTPLPESLALGCYSCPLWCYPGCWALVSMLGACLDVGCLFQCRVFVSMSGACFNVGRLFQSRVLVSMTYVGCLFRCRVLVSMSGARFNVRCLSQCRVLVQCWVLTRCWVLASMLGAWFNVGCLCQYWVKVWPHPINLRKHR